MVGGLGALAVVVGTPQAHAATALNMSTGGSVWLDVDGNTANGGDLRIYAHVHWWMLSATHGLEVAMATGLIGVWTTGAYNFSKTTQIAGWPGAWSAGQVWDYHFGTNWTGYWDQGTAYLGFRVPDGGGGYDYGWVQISPSNGGLTLTIDAYGAAGSGSGAGGGLGSAVGTPEPAASGLGLLGLGAAGVMRHRRRRKE